MICQNCGSEISDNSKFCGKCGKRIELIKPKKKFKWTKKKLLILSVCIGVIISLSCGGYIYYKNTPEQRAIAFAKGQASNMANSMSNTLLTSPDKVESVEKENDNVYKITFDGTYITWPDSHPENENPESHKYNAIFYITIKLENNNQFSLESENIEKGDQIY